MERLQDFVSENKRGILIGTVAALLAVGGIVAYQSHVAASGRRRSRRGSLEKGEGEEGKKKKSGGKKKKTVKDSDGPIIEEREKDPVKPAGEPRFFIFYFFLVFSLCSSFVCR